MNFSGFIENLKIHEKEMKAREERETPNKKAIAFKATPSSFNDEESSEDGDEDTWSEAIAKDYEANAKAQYALTQALNDDDLSCVINCKSAYKVWNDLIITHEGISQVKRSKFDLLCSQYENFYMLENKSIDEMLARSPRLLMVYLL